MNNRAKGNLHEKRVADYLQSQGYLVERGFKKTAFIKGRLLSITKDLFGVFDIVAVLPRRPEVRLIQVTAGGVGDANKRREKVAQVWDFGEVWEHIRRGVYQLHRVSGRVPEVIDIRADSGEGAK